jgi:hypothetical protein
MRAPANLIPLGGAPLLLLLATLCVIPAPVDAQYFGRNKVQYDRFDFRVLETPNFEIHFYPEAAEVIEDAARMAERWYERHARLFGHEIPRRRPLVLYADHPDFQQTNILQGSIGEATGGVTEGLRDRIIMPLGNSYGDTDHVLGHELVHTFQFDLAGQRRGGLPALMRLPLWFVEGMAEYFSVGPESTLSAMWLRDALLRDEFPTTDMLTRDQGRYFPYRFGHAFFAWVGGTYGDEAVGQLLRVAMQAGFAAASATVLGVPPDTLSARWREAAEALYAPQLEGRSSPAEVGTLLLSPETGAGRQNVAPSLSPDGRYIAFLSERDLFTIELFLADASTGEIIRRLTSSVRDAHFDAIRFLDSSGGWSPDGEEIAVVIFVEGQNSIQLYGVDGSRRQRLIVPREIGEIRGPTYSPDGRTIAFSAQVGGRSDLFMVDIASGDLTRLTNDRYTALQPVFSPDGATLAFVTDRGPGTDFDRLTWGPMGIGVLDLASREIERLAPLGSADHWNPQFSPDGASLFFLADPDGFRDIFRVDLDGGALRRVTHAATAVSGITDATPALTVAAATGNLAFSLFTGGEYHIFEMPAAEARGEPVSPEAALALEGRRLPGAPAPGISRVEQLLADADVGLPAAGSFRAEDARVYSPRLGLDWIGQGGVGVGADQFGTFVGGSVAVQFGDMLGNRTLAAAIQAQGEIQDIGGQIFYQNVERRWNWGVGAAHIPFRYFQTGTATDPQTGNALFIRDLQRIRQTQAQALLQYPFSTVRRMEATVGYSRYDFDARRDIFTVDGLGRIIDQERLALATPEAVNMGQASLAFVEDNSFFGFNAPVRGWRARYEVSQTVGDISFTQGLVDHRRYFAPLGQLTLAARGMHIGRYALNGTDLGLIRPFYVGWETFVRGYSSRSFEVQECTADGSGGCPEFDRLLGHRIGVANLELRIPVLGVERWGLINFPYLPTDLVLFGDAGVAWNEGDGAELRFERETTARVPVFSAGASARMNILGALILEIYYAYPWQRPIKGAHWGFHLAPGW